MDKISFKIPIYDFDITIIEIKEHDTFEFISKFLKKFHLPNKELGKIENNMLMGMSGGGVTYRCMERKMMLVIIYPCKNETERRNVLNHEKRHVEDRILEFCEINDKEASAYLAGYIGQYVY